MTREEHADGGVHTPAPVLAMVGDLDALACDDNSCILTPTGADLPDEDAGVT